MLIVSYFQEIWSSVPRSFGVFLTGLFDFHNWITDGVIAAEDSGKVWTNSIFSAC